MYSSLEHPKYLEQKNTETYLRGVTSLINSKHKHRSRLQGSQWCPLKGTALITQEIFTAVGPTAHAAMEQPSNRLRAKT